MAKSRSKYKHLDVLIPTGKNKQIYLTAPGTIVKFKYRSQNNFDMNPTVLLLFSDK